MQSDEVLSGLRHGFFDRLFSVLEGNIPTILDGFEVSTGDDFTRIDGGLQKFRQHRHDLDLDLLVLRRLVSTASYII